MASELIWVESPVKTPPPGTKDAAGRVVLWERSESHPNGEIFVTTCQEPQEAFPTERVQELLREGTLNKVAKP